MRMILAIMALVVAGHASAEPARRGRVTSLPVPRFVSLKSGAANVRRGPSLSNRIDWVLRHRGTPLMVRAEYKNWFRVEDVDGEGGWIYTKLLSERRTVLVRQNLLALRQTPSDSGPMLARLEAGVLPRLTACQPQWCQVSIEGYRGWLPKNGIWGVLPDEVFE